MRMLRNQALVLTALLVLLGGCSSDGGDGGCDPANPDCDEGLVCESVQGGEPRCVLPLEIQGAVIDSTTKEGIAGALVQAVDPNETAVGTSAETGGNGSFTLTVPAVRNAEGEPAEGTYTLRSQAAGYQPFPTAIRPALPQEAVSAVEGDAAWVLESTLTTVELLPLPGGTSGLGSISGTVDADTYAGVLLVAEGGGGGYPGFSDSEGQYTIFNVPAGSYTVGGYIAGEQYEPVDITLTAGADQSGVDLTGSDSYLSSVSGTVQLVEAPGGAQTSVILAVESTLVEDAARGLVPPGLRVGNVTTQYTIEGVPDGRYVVLAAFENDGLVRDPDQTIGGTNIVHIEVPDPDSGNAVSISEGFKVTEALEIYYPGAEGPEAVTAAIPTLIWADDASEDGYEIQVFDAYGNEIWSEECDRVTGEETVEQVYAGPALEEEMYYQFRVTSFRDKQGGRTFISTTEDLKGVFYREVSN